MSFLGVGVRIFWEIWAKMSMLKKQEVSIPFLDLFFFKGLAKAKIRDFILASKYDHMM